MDGGIFDESINQAIQNRYRSPLLGALILGSGFYITTNESFSFLNFLAPYSLMITGLLAFMIAFGFSSLKDLFAKPRDPNGNIKNFIKYFILTTVLGFASAAILQYVLNLNLASNPEAGDLSSIILQVPFMLLGEELIRFYFLLVTANLIFQKTGNQKQAELLGIIISSILFGLLHYTTYYNGNPIETLAHVLLIQGSARIAFNLSGLKANSILMPLIIHIIYDLIFLALS